MGEILQLNSSHFKNEASHARTQSVCSAEAELCVCCSCVVKKEFYVLRHICPNMSAGAVIGYVGIAVSDKLVNRKEVRSTGSVLISTSGFFSLLLETSRDKNVMVKVENGILQT